MSLWLTRNRVAPVYPFIGNVKVRKSFVPSNFRAGLPFTAFATNAGCCAATACAAFTLLPDWSFHCVTAEPFSVAPASAFSQSFKPEVGG